MPAPYPAPNEDKQRLRRPLLQQRALAAAHYRKDSRASDNLLALFRRFLMREFEGSVPSPCSGYLPIRNEIDPRALMDHLRLQHKVDMLLPVVCSTHEPLVFRTFEGDEETLQTGAFETKHPPEGVREETPALMLVPLLAFDRACRRLGYGGGFYDRTLEDLASKGVHPFTLGIAFEAQRIDALPVEPHDKPLNAVLSETRLYRRS